MLDTTVTGAMVIEKMVCDGAGVDEEVVSGLMEELGSGSAELQQVATEQIRRALCTLP